MICPCGCGREVKGKKIYFESTCWKKVNSKRHILKRKEAKLKITLDAPNVTDKEIMTVRAFAVLKETAYHTIKNACETNKLDIIIKKKGWFVIMNEKADNFDPELDGRKKYVVLKTEKNHRGIKVPQPSWTYRNDCMGAYIFACAQEEKKNKYRKTESACF